jgi:hypothetical protein
MRNKSKKMRWAGYVARKTAKRTAGESEGRPGVNRIFY